MGDRIRGMREKAGLSRLGLAYKAGINPRTVERIEAGQIRNPRQSTLKVIEIALQAEGLRL